jgi:hypothetical protein
MQIICKLISRAGLYELVTSHEMKRETFGAHLDNPFPCSELYSVTACEGSPLTVTYQVEKVFGEAA